MKIALKRWLIVGFSIMVVWAIAFASPVLAADTANGAQIFAVHCAGCHVNGGNIIRWNKTLKLRSLEWNKVNTMEAIATLVANGKANMSAYKDRLSQAEIEDVSAYVLEQASKGWR